jgi:hypothetical protein
VGHYERDDRAQAVAKKIQDMHLPAFISPRSLGSIKYYLVFCGPIDGKRVGAVSERLEAKNLSILRTTNNPSALLKQRP